MTVIIYADFNCPYCYLASQRAEVLMRRGSADVDWRAAEHDPGLPMPGRRPEAGPPAWEAEMAEVAGLARPGEDVPAAPPPVISNTAAAVAAYAEAVSEGVQDELKYLAGLMGAAGEGNPAPGPAGAYTAAGGGWDAHAAAGGGWDAHAAAGDTWSSPSSARVP